MPERFALYYAPPRAHPLWIKAAQWLGRDPATGAVAPVEIDGIATSDRLEISESARRYGFHATIKAPMALSQGTSRDALEEELRRFGARTAPAAIGRLKLSFIDGFLALVPVEQTAALTEAAALVVTHFEPFRAALAPSDREKRVRNGALTPRQVALLDHYGYPYVLDEFRFHLTLTDRLPKTQRDPVMAAAEGWFGPLLGEDLVFDRIALYAEAEPGAPFVRLADFPLAAKVAIDA